MTDVVDGIIATLKYQPRQCGETFNLGRSQPEVVSQLVGFLEEDLGKKAVVVSIWLIVCVGVVFDWLDFRMTCLSLQLNYPKPLQMSVFQRRCSATTQQSVLDKVVCLSICLSAYLPVCLSVRLSVRSSVCLSVCLPVECCCFNRCEALCGLVPGISKGKTSRNGVTTPISSTEIL